MKAIMIMFDSLNKHMLPCYGCDWISALNFKRLAEHTVVFDNAYVGSMPCMPARRELHTGRYNFLHRSWGPIEPFDDSAIEIMKENNVYTHLVTDHAHYWEDGGATYHVRYDSFDFIRGQEGDPWKADVKAMQPYDKNVARRQIKGKLDQINREYMPNEEDQPQAKTFTSGIEFIHKNHDSDRWFLQLETFDPHEPFFSKEKYKKLYPHKYEGPLLDWPRYGAVNETPQQIEHLRYEYAALLSMCDNYLGKILDLMDEYDMWKDTMLIVNTDHGFLLSEHDYWAKNVMPWYNELARIPLFIWDPRSKRQGQYCDSLVQTIDLPATILEYFGIDLPKDMQGVPLKDAIAENKSIREAGLFGIFGGHVNCTDGRYVYMRGVANEENEPLYQYTYMPTHLSNMFSVESMRTVELAEPFDFTKGCRPMKIKAGIWGDLEAKDPYVRTGRIAPDHLKQNFLFDLENDPQQLKPINDPEIEKYMIYQMVKLMKANDAPDEQYIRLGLSKD